MDDDHCKTYEHSDFRNSELSKGYDPLSHGGLNIKSTSVHHGKETRYAPRRLPKAKEIPGLHGTLFIIKIHLSTINANP